MTRLICDNNLFLRGVAPELPKALPGSDPHSKYRQALAAVQALGVDPLELLAYAVFVDAESEVDETDCCESAEAHIGHAMECEWDDVGDDLRRRAQSFAREADSHLERLSRG